MNLSYQCNTFLPSTGPVVVHNNTHSQNYMNIVMANCSMEGISNNKQQSSPYLLSAKKNKNGHFTQVALASRGSSDRKDKILSSQLIKFE